MRIDVVTIFPACLDPLRESLPGKAIHSGLVDLRVHDLRHWTYDVHHSVDDAPYGGGPGMVMKAPVWGDALDEICSAETLLVVPTPAGSLFTQATAQRWSAEAHLVFACGRYEGIDQRVVEDAARRMRVEEVSIGDYVLPGGESAAVVMIEAVVRLLAGRAGQPRVGVRRFALSGAGPVAGGAELHPTAELARPGRARGPAFGRSRANHRVAPRRLTAAHPGTSPGPRPARAKRRGGPATRQRIGTSAPVRPA